MGKQKVGLARPLFLSVITALLTASSSFADPVDLIVRFREPQNNQKFAAFTLNQMGVFAGHGVDVINHEEGVVRLSFASAEEAREAREQLLRTGDVLNVAPNLMYQPQVIYRFEEKKESPVANFLGAPLFRAFHGAMSFFTDATIPAVELPSRQGYGADPLASKDWALKNINLAAAGTRTVTGKVVTAVIDTGIDYNHEDLISGMWRMPGNPHEVGYDFAQDNAKPYDLVHFDVDGCLKDLLCRTGLDTSAYLVNPGHGTHCAGHVAAVYNNGTGMRGVGAGAQVMALKGFYDVGHAKAGQGDDAALIKSIDYAVKNGAKVISASWGGRSARSEAELSEMKQALIRAQKAGVLVVVAAGNDGIDQEAESEPVFPAAYDLDNLIVVAASDKDDSLADFSNYGARSVDLAAPGVRILSTVPESRYSDIVATYTGPNGQKGELAWDGTSMATPIVAGAAALVWSKYPQADYREIKKRILKSVRRVPALEGKVLTAGVLDVAAALR